MPSLNHVEILGALFSEYWRYLEDTMSPAELKEWTRLASTSSSSSSPTASTTVTRLPPLNWTGLAAEFYTKTGMLLLPQHLVDCYLAVLETRCGGEVKELHRLFGATARGASTGPSRPTAKAEGGTSPSAGTRRSASGGGGGGSTASAPTTALSGRGLAVGVSPPHASDDARGFFEEGDPMSPLGRRDASSGFAALGSRASGPERGAPSGASSTPAVQSGGSGEAGADGRPRPRASEDQDGLFHCDTPDWVRGLSMEQQQRLQRLRHETPLSPEILAQLLEQLSLVEGAPLFMNSVQPQTMMMYNGVSAGPYKHVIHKPMCLVVMKANVAESRRTYHLRTTVTEEAEGDQDGDGAERRGVKRPRGGGGGEAGSGGAGGGPSTGGAGNAGEASAVSELALSENGSLNRVLTLADVERAVWQTAANCAMFNAPESDYPFSARRFAVGCMKVLETYCHQQLLVE